MAEKVLFAALFGLCLGIVTSVESDFIGECVYAHNKARIQHEDTPPLKWDAALADNAQKNANYLTNRNKALPGKSYIINHSNAAGHLYGENIYAGTHGGFLQMKIGDAMYLWYREGINYNYWNLAPRGLTGHFTQVIWKSTTSVGCGIATYFKHRSIHTIIVCQYKTKGNVKTQYLRNVRKLKKHGKERLSVIELNGTGRVAEPQPSVSSCAYTDSNPGCRSMKKYCIHSPNFMAYLHVHCQKTCLC
eukprot:Seg636.3_Seg636.4 transcript_id=Seg636.3_Seg636.4/GoldUCD/mRNA.D3Y31 product="Protein PRY1" protein_id=Seg636.3_Seg636.4/GoldUCD/D3Y31